MAYLKNEKLKEVFIHKGVLQEANRSFFHPLGLALALLYFEESETMELRVQYTEDDEGYVFPEIDKSKREAFRKYANDKYEKRQDALSYIIQIRNAAEEEMTIKKEKPLPEKRYEILSKYLSGFTYEMQREFQKHHQDKDNVNTFISEDEAFCNLINNVQSEDWLAVACYAFIMAHINSLQKEISNLGGGDTNG